MAEDEALAAARWSARAAAEAASADRFDQIAVLLPAHGVPDPLVDRLLSAAADERRHASICAEIAQAFPNPTAPDPRALGLPTLRGATPAARLAEELTFLLAAGETLAIALLDAAAAPPCAPTIADALRQIQADEVRHAALGWALLDALRTSAPDAEAWAPALSRMGALVVFGAIDGAPERGIPTWGVLDRGTVRRQAGAALSAQIAPALARRGLWAPPPAPSGP
jgi:hypothetical protein